MGFAISEFPYNAKWEELKKYNLDALFLTSGPGNPMDIQEVVKTVKDALSNIPVFGVSLGAQVLNLALGGTIKKMNNGHRGANHPVKDIARNRIYVTSQNHGYTIDQLGNAKATHLNLNDNTVEGFKNEELSAMGVQFLPESYPEDSNNLFADFLKTIEK